MILNKNTNIKPGYFIFYYHDISDNQLIPNNVRTSPERFKKEILFFLNNFEVVSLEKQINLIKKERVATYPTCSICFDDGYLSVLKFAHPFLIKHKIHHTLFLNSEIISNKNLWLDNVILFNLFKRYGKLFFKTNFEIELDESNLSNFLRKESNPQFRKKLLKLMKFLDYEKIFLDSKDLLSFDKEYIDFGSHTYSHLHLSNLNYKEQRNEIKKCRNVLTKNKIPFSLFCIPFGDDKSFNNDTEKLIMEYYGGVLIKGNGSINHTFKKNILEIERIGLNNNKKSIETHIYERLFPSIKDRIKRILKFSKK
ncbi:MAG: polysaccharide deacetylase family protein [Alphaproteobacteria bacterium]